jgi:GT2 family glycosyltransferase
MKNNGTCSTDAGEVGLVSVVIPNYNRAYILGRTIDSVLQQTYRPVDVIVIDDRSTDDTRRLVEAFGSAVRYFYQINAGVSAARNRGFREARGEFVALLDSDDSWCSWKLRGAGAFDAVVPRSGNDLDGYGGGRFGWYGAASRVLAGYV